MKHGLFGIQGPNVGVAFNLLFPSRRGLFFWTPFLLLSVFGYRSLFHLSRPSFWLVMIVPLVQVLVISGYVWDWPAGWALGPRYLAPILPLLLLPAALVTEKHLFLGGYLASISILLTGLATHIDATPPPVSNLLLEKYLPELVLGDCGFSLGKLAGLGGHASLCLFWATMFPLIGGLVMMARTLEKRGIVSRT